MAKRSSDHQITRDDESEGEEASAMLEVKVGMTKADPSVLASRPMRGLPKRKGTTPLVTSGASSNGSSAEPNPKPTFSGFGGFGTTPAPAAESKPEGPRFGGFTGFGAPAAAPATTPAAPKPAEAPRFAAFAGFGAPPAPAAKTDAPVESKPAEPPRFGNFAGFGTLKPATTAPTSTPKPEAPKPATESKSDTTAALTYWTSLRGLNHAFSENVKKAIETDMFCDLSVSFKQYQEFREKVVKDYEQAKKTTEAPAPTETKPAETKPAFGFGASSSSTAKDSPFSFGSNPSSTASTTSKPPSFGLGLPTSKPLGFGSTNPPLVTPAATPPVEPPSPKKPAPFTSALGAVPEATPTPSPLPGAREPNPFDFSATKNDASTPKPVGSEEKEKASTNVFGGGASKPAFTFGSGASTPFGTTTTTKPDAKPFSFNTSNTTGFSGFGSSTAPSPALSTTASAGSSVPPSTKPFAFTTPLSTPGTPFAFGAGSPKNNATPRPGSSVGFSFGNSPPRKEPASFPFGNSVTGPTSGDATPKSETGPSNSDEEKDKPKEGEPEEEDTDKAQTAGAGEENEDTLFSARARVLRFYKQAWVGVGIGQFKIKFDRETKKRRILHRLEGTGRVVLNCGLFDQMNPVLEPKGLVRFTGTDEQGHPMLYRVKVKAEADAESLVNAFKEALEAYQAEKDD